MPKDRFHWKQFLNLGEELLRQTNTRAQQQLIERTVAKKLGCTAKIWLSESSYPLPCDNIPLPLLRDARHAAVLHAHTHSQPACLLKDSPAAQQLIPAALPYSIALPLKTQEHLLGVLLAEKKVSETFKPEELEYLEQVVAHTALALQVTRQTALKNWRHEQINLVRSISAQITKVSDLEQLFHQATHLIQESFGYHSVALFSLTQDRATLRLQSYASADKKVQLPNNYSVRIGKEIVGLAALNNEELVVQNMGDAKPSAVPYQLPQTQAEAAFPLKIDNRLLGIMDVQSVQGSAFHETDLLVLRSLADSIAMAIEENRVYADLQDRAEQVSAILEISHKLNSILDLDSLLQEIVQIIHHRFGYPFVQIFSVDTNREMVVYETSSEPRHPEGRMSTPAYALDDAIGIIPWVARTNTPWVSNNVTSDALYRESGLFYSKACSEMAVPLSYAGNVVGVLDIQSEQTDAFIQNDLTLIEGLGAGIAIAMRNASLYKTEKWRRQAAESLNQVARLISANTALDTLLDSILSELERNLSCQVAAIWLMDERDAGTKLGQRPLILAALHGADPVQINETRQQNPEVRKWLETIANSQEAAIRRDGDIFGPIGTALDYPQDYSAIAVPLRAGNRTVGVVELAHTAANLYDGETASLVSAFAGYAAITIQNARLFSEAQEQAWISNVLLQAAGASQSATTIEDLFETMVRLTPLLIGIEKCAIFLLDDQGAAFELKAAHSLDIKPENKFFRADQHPAFARLKSTRKVVHILKPAAEVLNLAAELKPNEDETMVLLPLLMRGELVGAFLVIHRVTGQPGAKIHLTGRTLSILQGIARHTAIAYENLRLAEYTLQEGYIAAVMLQVAQAISTKSNLEDALYTIVNLMPILVGIDASVIYLWDSAAQEFKPAQAYASSKKERDTICQHPVAVGEASLLDKTFEENQPHFCPLTDLEINLDHWENINCQPAASILFAPTAPQGGWLMAFPLSNQGEKFGVLLTHELNAPSAFQQRRVEMLSGIAQQIALAIENETLRVKTLEGKRIEQEVQTARQIQITFLPNQLPEISGWDFNARWQTAQEVGGDFYDIFPLDGCHTAVVIADVSDKGMPAALYMTVTRTLIRAFAKDRLSPAAVLEKVNGMLVSDSQDGLFVTAVYAVLCTEDGSLVYANAGHNQPFLLHSSQNRAEALPKGDLAMGVLEDIRYQDYRFTLEPNDALFLYTDGLTDTFSPAGESFGEARLQDALLRVNRENSTPMLSELDQILKDFRQDAPVFDDLTILCIHRQPDFPQITPKKRTAATK